MTCDVCPAPLPLVFGAGITKKSGAGGASRSGGKEPSVEELMAAAEAAEKQDECVTVYGPGLLF